MSSEKKIVEEKISTKTWLSLVVYIILLNVFIVTLTLFITQPWASGLNPGPSGGVFAYMVLPYVVSFLLTFPIMWGWIKISKLTMVLIYVATMIGAWYSCPRGMWSSTIAYLYLVRTATAEVHGYAVPYFWIPSTDAIKGAFYHGSLGNLFITYASEWAPVALTWILYYVTAGLYMIGWASVLRRLWVDIEVLPFPHAQGWLIAENALQTTPSRSKKLMIATATFGFIIWIPYMLRALSPAFPDLYGWLTNPNFANVSLGTFYISDAFPFLQQILPAPLYISTSPFKYAFMFLLPLDSLFSMWVGYILMAYLVPYVLYYMGFYSGLFSVGANKFGMLWTSPPYHLLTIVHGYALGLFIFLLLINWKYFLETIKAAVSDRPPEGELSLRVAYVLMFLGAVGWLILFVLSKVDFLVAILGLLIITLQSIVMTRMRAYAGAITRIEGVYFWKPFLGDTMPPAPKYPGGTLFIVSHTSYWGLASDTFGPYITTLAGTLDSFKVASQARVHPMTILKLILIGAITSAIVTAIVLIIEIHALGFMEVPAQKAAWDVLYQGDAGYYNARLSVTSLQGLIGFILSAFLVFMRVRFAWWPVEPVSFIVGVGNGWASTTYIGLPLTALIAWILKYAVLRIGGRKTYEEIAIPIVLGDIAGEMTGVILTVCLTIIRVVFLKG
ncbi:MAG: DUF6785 family protein [Thermoproteota archaeon]